MENCIRKDGKDLRLGYTTGSCAAAAAKAAAWMLLTGKRKESITLLTPKGIELSLQVEEITLCEDFVRCAIRKDSGDDPDVTNGAYVFAEVRKIQKGILIDGGLGVGRVTKPGLDQPVGNAAINSGPRTQIAENLQQVMDACDYQGGLSVVLSVPLGQELAKKTFNPRLGIEGGISILGTTGIVEPMSEKALVDTIRTELSQKRAMGADAVMLTPGNYGSDFIREELGIDPKTAVQISNFVGDSLDICKELGFSKVLLVGHVGKLVKLAGNMMNTHSKYGDCRMEIMASHGAKSGAAADAVGAILESVSCDEAIRILKNTGTWERTAESLTSAIDKNLRLRAAPMEIAFLTFSKEYGLLAKTKNSEQILEECK